MTQNVNTRPGGTPTWTRDATANDSDKTFTVPSGKLWELCGVEAYIITSADVGNRVLAVTIQNTTPAVVWASVNTGNVAASNKGFIACHPGSSVGATTTRWGLDDANQAGTNISDVFPQPCLLPAGYSIRVRDVNAVAAAADDMTVALHYIEYEA